MGNGKVYFLDLQTLLTYLSGQSCILTTDSIPSTKKAIGFVRLKEGEITHCYIQYQNGSQIEGERAYQQLQESKQWQVELEQQEETSTFAAPQVQHSMGQLPAMSTNSSASSSDFNIPPSLWQKRENNTSLLQNFPTKQRLILHTVLTMVNGKRTTEEIKARLNLPAATVESALKTLIALKVIE